MIKEKYFIDNKPRKKIITFVIASLLSTATPSFAQLTTTSGATTGTPQLMIPQYSQQDLINQGCDPNNWNSLVQQYVNQRTVERQIQGQSQHADQVLAAPGISAGRCLEQLMNQINQIMSIINTIIALFTGSIDWGAIGRSILNQMTEWACNTLNTYTGNMAYGATQPVIGQISGVVNTVNGGQTVNTGPNGPTISTGQIITPNNNTNTIQNLLNGSNSTVAPTGAANPFNGASTGAFK